LLRTDLNNYLDGLTRTEVRLFNKRRHAFRVCGLAGIALGVGLASALTIYQRLSLVVLLLMVLTAAATFVVYVLMSKVFTGEENLTLYRQTIAVMLAESVVLRLLNVPVLAYLDVAAIGAGAILSFGRAGCFLVGCCHGRPHAFGACYRAEHVDAGFAPHLACVRLFPVQAIESLYTLCLTLACAAFVLFGETTGVAFASFVVGYAAGRFNFEFMRGDTARRFFAGFSEAQWISLTLAFAFVNAELFGVIAFRAWHAAIFACLALLALGVGLRRRFSRTLSHRLLDVRHVEEVAQAVKTLSDEADERASIQTHAPEASSFRIARTSLGIQISANRIESAEECIQQFSFSSSVGQLTVADAETLSKLIVLLRAAGSHELVEGNGGVFHLLIHARQANETARPSTRTYMEGSRYAV
jgi:hypothetical protein